MTSFDFRQHFARLLWPLFAFSCSSRDVVAVSDAATSCAVGCECRVFEAKPYMFCPELASWTAASAICEEHGMGLARIDSAEENLWVRATADEGAFLRLWIGTSDQAEEGTWRWPDGDLVLLAGAGDAAPGYHDFPGEEPNRGRGSNCGSMHESGSWHDQPCSYERSFVCNAPAP